MQHNKFEKYIVEGVKNVLNNPQNYTIDGGYDTNGSKFYQTEYYVFSNKDNRIVFSVKPDRLGGILFIANNRVILSIEGFNKIFDLTHSAFLNRPEKTPNNINKNINNSDSLMFLADFSDKIDYKWLNNENREQNLVNIVNGVLNNKKTIIYSGTTAPWFCANNEAFYVYSGITNQRLYCIEHSPLLHDLYAMDIDFQKQTLSVPTLKSVFSATKQQYEKTQKALSFEEHQEFTLKYLSDYSIER